MEDEEFPLKIIESFFLPSQFPFDLFFLATLIARGNERRYVSKRLARVAFRRLVGQTLFSRQSSDLLITRSHTHTARVCVSSLALVTSRARGVMHARIHSRDNDRFHRFRRRSIIDCARDNLHARRLRRRRTISFINASLFLPRVVRIRIFFLFTVRRIIASVLARDVIPFERASIYFYRPLRYLTTYFSLFIPCVSLYFCISLCLLEIVSSDLGRGDCALCTQNSRRGYFCDARERNRPAGRGHNVNNVRLIFELPFDAAGA